MKKKFGKKGRFLALVCAIVLLVTSIPVETYAATTGTKGSPYKLTNGTTKTIKSVKDYWFTCNSAGATNIKVTTDQYATITVYKKNLTGKKKLYSTSNVLTFSKKITDTKICTNQQTYYVHVTLKKKGMVSCKISQYRDSKVRAKGARWLPKANSPVANSNILYEEYYFIPKEHVDAVYNYVTDGKFADNQTKLYGYYTGIADVLATLGIEMTVGEIPVVVSLISCIVSNKWGQDFKEAVVQDARTAGGYSKKTKKFKYGIILIEYRDYKANRHYKVERWDGKTMYGPYGYIGTWDLEYNK